MTSFFKRHQRLLVTLGSATFIIVGTYIAIQFAKGYRPTTSGDLRGTGLLSVTSNPQNSQVYINGTLQDRVTDNTIGLRPGEYDVEIRLEGFTSWKKRLLVEQELVTSTNAELFRNVPSLNPLTFAGAHNLTPSPDGQKIAFAIASPSAQLKAGLYVLRLSDRTNFFSKSVQLIAEAPGFGQDFRNANLLWSPDSSQLITSFPSANYLLNPTQTTRREQLVDATNQISFLLTAWEQEIVTRERQLLSQLPDEMVKIATESAKNLYFSPDGEKLLYTATQEITIPPELIPPLPASNNQPENRNLSVGNLYIYDLKEDKNFLVYQHPTELPPEDFTKPQLVTTLTDEDQNFLEEATSSAQPLLQDATSLATTITNFKTQYSSFPFTNYQWFPTSRHMLFNNNGVIQVIEYDGTNLTTLFQGNYEEDFVYPWPNGTKLIILTNVAQNPDLPPNLYAINLK